MSPDKAEARATGQRLLAAFREAGAAEVEADILQPAEVLLDLYGEDIRARAFVTQDPLRGEMMLRPDFTVPVVQMHMANGADPARYCYFGEVFRKQGHRGPRAPEYFQVGYEVFARDDAPAADAEVFALIAGLLAPLGLRAAIGDIGILMAAVGGLNTLPGRKAALLRHIWRPRRFHALLDRFGGKAPVPAARADLLARIAAGTADIDAPLIGLRSAAEIESRLAALAEDAAAPPIATAEVALLNALFDLAAPAPEALSRLQDLAREMPAIAPAVAGLARRLDAMATRGVDVAALAFEASHGRSTMEYYDGFVFSVRAADPALPPVASGGRYDALTRVLGRGGGRSIPAVGGVIRPGLVASLEASLEAQAC
ncbi:ATP phosphoribosyltransferase regulatory subunit [Frigidibacter albus]|uniref:Histidine--tRNA ligase n=1 Tax=Frigidibacter albus TaxID=1465486 RepID=A0A6L8VEQ4_9RHOB|nr:ATP phosphoribosyltransferase regulatory subunit [Frigidibacter albus]MZQ88634.1 ATP phosphoribosyltransferase regulatory subunit [Frigidibacter albus]NBE30557.1 ATP phosphoribosyltransferase regulatory subunit [Frigidibacter albus]GGH49558.1 ATP phosphoribosyltransferase regulatory subunit [Frigidibacter albus]